MSMTMGSKKSRKIEETESRRTLEPKSNTYFVNANIRLMYWMTSISLHGYERGQHNWTKKKPQVLFSNL